MEHPRVAWLLRLGEAGVLASDDAGGQAGARAGRRAPRRRWRMRFEDARERRVA